MSTNLETLGARVREARKEKRMTQQEMAGRMNVSVQSVSQWETDRTRPALARIFDIAEILGLTVEWLLGGEGTKDAPQYDPGLIRTRLVRELRWQEIKKLGFFGSEMPPDEDLEPESILAQMPAVRELFAVRVCEDDNSPQFGIGDLIIADTGVKARPGDFVFAELAHEEHILFRQLKSLKRQEDGSLVGELRPLNPDYPVEQIVIHVDDNRDRIIGVMVEHRRFRRN